MKAVKSLNITFILNNFEINKLICEWRKVTIFSNCNFVKLTLLFIVQIRKENNN